METSVVPPPGGAVVIVVSTLMDPVIQAQMARYPEFHWTDSACGAEKFDRGDGFIALVYSVSMSAQVQDLSNALLSRAGARQTWFYPSFKELMLEAKRLYRPYQPKFAVPAPISPVLAAQLDAADDWLNERVLMAGFDSQDFPSWAKNNRVRWWTSRQALGLVAHRELPVSMQTEIRRHGVKFVIFSTGLPVFHRERHLLALRRNFSDRNTRTAADNQAAEILLQQILDRIEERGTGMENAVALKDGQAVLVAVEKEDDFLRYQEGEHGEHFVVMGFARLRELVKTPEQFWPRLGVGGALIYRHMGLSVRNPVEDLVRERGVGDVRLIRNLETIHQALSATRVSLAAAAAQRNRNAEFEFPQELNIAPKGKIAFLGISIVVARELGLFDSQKYLVLDRAGAQHLQTLTDDCKVPISLDTFSAVF